VIFPVFDCEGVNVKMMAVIWVDFLGTNEELKEIDKAYKKAAEKTKGMEYMGRYTSWSQKWNWGYFFKIECAGTMDEYFKNMNVTRDYRKMPYGAVEFLPGPM
jgi:hypothetical protein